MSQDKSLILLPVALHEGRLRQQEDTLCGCAVRHLFSLSGFFLACALILPGQTLAQSQLVFAISEGTSGGLEHAQVIAKYQGLANVIGNAMKTKVSVVFAREFLTLENGMKAGRFEFVMARPSDYPARAIRDDGYSFIASAKPDGQCFIIVPSDSSLKTLDQAKGRRFAMPEKVSYMSRFCAAELRDRGFDLAKENVQYVREQAAVGFYLQNKFADVGAIASYSGFLISNDLQPSSPSEPRKE
jgi:phosphonate transport system substrate-binding protein